MRLLTKKTIRTLADCQTCGLFQTCQSSYIEGYGPKDAAVLIVLDAPGYEEDAYDHNGVHGKPGVGRSGKFLKTCLQDAGIDPASCYFVNAVACMPPEDSRSGGVVKVTEKQIKACKPVVQAVIERLKPKLVLLAGGTALKSLLNRKSVVSFRGEVFQKGDVRCVATWNPAYVLAQMDHTPTSRRCAVAEEFAEDLNRLRPILDGTDTRHRPPLPINEDYDPSKLVAWIKEARATKRVSFDYETSGLEMFKQGFKILSVALSWRRPGTNELVSLFIPLDHRESVCEGGLYDHLSLLEIKAALRDLLKDPEVRLIGSNLKFEFLVSALHLNADIAVQPWDIGQMLFLIDENRHGPRNNPPYGQKRIVNDFTTFGGYEHELKDKLAEHFRIGPHLGILSNTLKKKFRSAKFKPLGMGDLEHVPLSWFRDYNAWDAYTAYLVYEVLIPMLKKRRQLWLYKNVTMEAIRAFADIELAGWRLDYREHKSQLAEVDVAVSELFARAQRMPSVQRFLRKKREQELNGPIQSLGGGKFQHPGGKVSTVWPYKWSLPDGSDTPLNLDSPQQLLEFVFRFRGWTLKSGEANSLNKKALEELKGQGHAFAKLLGQYRAMKQRLKLYLKPAQSWVQDDGLCRGSYRINGAKTGRPSCSRPNCNNIARG